MNLKDCKMVIAIAETGSVSRAAEKLYISQPYLSKSIAALESRLDTKLFDRSQSPLRLTSAGQIYLKYAQNFCAMEKLLETELKEPTHTIIKIGASGIITRTLLPTVLATFIERHPEVSVVLQDGGYIDLENFACQETTDLTLISQPSFISSAVYYEPLHSQRLLMAVPEGHRWFNPDATTEPKPFPFPVEELTKERYILPSARSSTRSTIALLEEYLGITFPMLAEVNHYETAFLTVKQMTDALGFVDEFYIKNYYVQQNQQFSNTKRVSLYYFEKWKQKIQIYAVYKNKTELVEEIIKILKNTLSKE